MAIILNWTKWILPPASPHDQAILNNNSCQNADSVQKNQPDLLFTNTGLACVLVGHSNQQPHNPHYYLQAYEQVPLCPTKVQLPRAHVLTRRFPHLNMYVVGELLSCQAALCLLYVGCQCHSSVDNATLFQATHSNSYHQIILNNVRHMNIVLVAQRCL